ncbi:MULTISPECIES: phosphatidylserine decarboxylase family protein [unclassified Apibacter]|uniref:phosphatidylserine decarboxylase family protein n=1 Tax=unclassified Apibacter TaxID=2630820 RepID=UPI00135EF574|nr:MULTISPECIES: phosphatidylserine decarboxylase family protein [unclassified Apibacter]MXP06096.1 phosphatidylserine decarboxylase family protein [Apibacter sp. B3546]MXP12951.1 phosphatidylserine decarboxylase family protein [Apibacter sp. B3239]
MRLHKEGKTIIGISLIVSILISILSIYFLNYWGLIIAVPVLVLSFFIVWFFRNPIRSYEAKANEIIAPVDGKVVIVKEVYEKEFLKTNCIQVSIFMSPLNVHVCRYPVSGKVIFKKYHPGKFLVAWHEKSSELNERTTVAVETEQKQKILFRQIAGAMARRIVIYSQIGDTAQAGKDFGFIKFGSRMDVFLPLGTEILVKVGDIIPDGGERVIARLKE